jgi:hypothetical protein
MDGFTFVLNVGNKAIHRVIQTLKESRIKYTSPSNHLDGDNTIDIHIKSKDPERKLQNVLTKAKELLETERRLEALYSKSPDFKK